MIVSFVIVSIMVLAAVVTMVRSEGQRLDREANLVLSGLRLPPPQETDTVFASDVSKASWDRSAAVVAR